MEKILTPDDWFWKYYMQDREMPDANYYSELQRNNEVVLIEYSKYCIKTAFEID